MPQPIKRSTKNLDCVQSLHALLPKIKILLCEDSSADCLLLRRELTRSGLEFDLSIVQTVADMVLTLRKHDFHLVLSDYHVPGYDITEAFQEVRRIDGDIPFIVMSGLAKESDIEALLHMGVNDFVSKHNPIRLVPSLCREIANTQKRVHRAEEGAIRRGLEDKIYLHQAQEHLLHDVLKISFRTTGVQDYCAALIKLLINCVCLPFVCAGRVHTSSPTGQALTVTYKADTSSSAAMQQWVESQLNVTPPTQAGLVDHEYILSRGEQVLGRLCLKSRGNRAFLQQIAPLLPRLLDTVSEGLHNKLSEQKIQHQALHHDLTHLPNKRYLLQQGERVLRERVSLDVSKQNAVVFVDIDNLKQTYDSLGSRISDALQVEVAKRLAHLVGKEGFVAHLDSDLFCMLVYLDESSQVGHLREVHGLIGAIKGISDGAIGVDDTQIFVTVSIGAALMEKGVDFAALMHRAELALHAARNKGRNSMRLFEPALSERANLRHQIEHDLRFAVEQAQFELYYQPQVEPKQGLVVGCEALIRWHHPVRGLVSPDEFISIAEESGQIHAIGRWVLEAACSQAKAWQTLGLRPLIMSVNISAAHFLQPGFVEQVQAVLNKTGLSAQWLELEITETVAMQISHMSQIVSMMHQLRDIGVSIAIDDFGTGFSSLRYIQKFPIEKLKVDRSFVKHVGKQDDGSLARSIILLAKNLSLKTVVEGVETEPQKQFFLAHGCDLIQGYYYSQPLPASLFYERLCDG